MHNNNKSVISSTTLSLRLFLSAARSRSTKFLKYVRIELKPSRPSLGGSCVTHHITLRAISASSDSDCAVSNGACTSFLNIFRKQHAVCVRSPLESGNLCLPSSPPHFFPILRVWLRLASVLQSSVVFVIFPDSNVYYCLHNNVLK